MEGTEIKPEIRLKAKESGAPAKEGKKKIAPRQRDVNKIERTEAEDEDEAVDAQFKFLDQRATVHTKDGPLNGRVKGMVSELERRVLEASQGNGTERSGLARSRRAKRRQRNVAVAAATPKRPNLFRVAKNIYRMVEKPRGYVVAINNIRFEDDVYGELPSGSVDVSRIVAAFEALHFRRIYKRNQTSGQMMELLRNISTEEELEKHNALVVVILSHGANELIYGSDNKSVHIRKIVDLFNNVSCPQLKGKPKLFFFHACRENKAIPEENVFKQQFMGAPYSDIILAYSTVTGFGVFDDDIHGSDYCKALASTLTTESRDKTFIEILNIVNKKVHEITIHYQGIPFNQAAAFEVIGEQKLLYFNPSNGRTRRKRVDKVPSGPPVVVEATSKGDLPSDLEKDELDQKNGEATDERQETEAKFWSQNDSHEDSALGASGGESRTTAGARGQVAKHRANRSIVWDYFDPVVDKPGYTQCRMCGVRYKYKNIETNKMTTSSMLAHLKKAHSVERPK